MPTLIIYALLLLMVIVTLSRFGDDAPKDDGVRPVWVGHCGGISYRWHFDPSTVPSGQGCVVERVDP